MSNIRAGYKHISWRVASCICQIGTASWLRRGHQLYWPACLCPSAAALDACFDRGSLANICKYGQVNAFLDEAALNTRLQPLRPFVGSMKTLAMCTMAGSHLCDLHYDGLGELLVLSLARSY